jgi:hypothetical protein
MAGRTPCLTLALVAVLLAMFTPWLCFTAFEFNVSPIGTSPRRKAAAAAAGYLYTSARSRKEPPKRSWSRPVRIAKSGQQAVGPSDPNAPDLSSATASWSQRLYSWWYGDEESQPSAVDSLEQDAKIYQPLISIPSPISALEVPSLEVPSLKMPSLEMPFIPSPMSVLEVPAATGIGATKDFFLFIKDYGWSLRYRVNEVASALDMEVPLQLDWVKLKRPISDPETILGAASDELFNWDVVEPPSYHGWMYQVKQAVGSGVEAVINILDGRGVSLLVQLDDIQVVNRPAAPSLDDQSEEKLVAESTQAAVTHGWVEWSGMSWLPIVQSVSFYYLQDVVLSVQA